MDLFNRKQFKTSRCLDYQQTRQGQFAESFLSGFKGVLQTDGYSGYHCVTKEKTVCAMGCWAHARRKFYDVWSLAQTEGVASKAVNIIGQLYGIEDEPKVSVAKLKIYQRLQNTLSGKKRQSQYLKLFTFI